MVAEKSSKILLIEDDSYFRRKIKKILEGEAKVFEAWTLIQAQQLLEQHHFDMVLIDLYLEEHNIGKQILKLCKDKHLFSIILTDNDDQENIREAYELGCDHYFSKDQCEKIIDLLAKERVNHQMEQSFSKFFQEVFLTQDQNLISEIKSLKSRPLLDRSLLLLGETGVGKGQLAQFIHQLAGGHQDNFIEVNVAAIPENLIESEFFGHCKGAFTGAVEERMGKLKLADGGTLFLDEVATMPFNMQKKLLKALEEKKFYPVGSNKAVESKFRLITATCDDIYQKIKEDEFRLDLFYRLNGLILDIPPLRKRQGDIPLIFNHFLQVGARKIYLEKEVWETLIRYSWPGNVRELKSMAEKLSMKQNGLVKLQDLPSYVRENKLPFQKSENRPEEFITLEQMDFLMKMGMKDFIEKLELEAFRSLSEQGTQQGQDPDELLNILKISRSGLYRLMKKSKEA